jgi:hypothetical protein
MIIALCGFANSGKSTIASRLIEKFNFQRVSFAEPVKRVAAVSFGWEYEKLLGQTTETRAWREEPDVFWSKAKGESFSPRQGLQLIGEGYRKLFHPDIWVQKAINTITKIRQTIHQPIVIDDMRYCNERNALEDIGAQTFIVVKPPLPTPEHVRVWDLGFTGNGIPNSSLHSSEWDWLRHPAVSDMHTPVIVNDGDIETLHKQTDLMYTRLLENDLAKRFPMNNTEAF